MKITQIIDRLRQLTQVNVQQSWLNTSEDISPNSMNFEQLELSQVNEQDYIIWEAGRKVKWLIQRFIIPKHLNGYPLVGFTLRLSLAWWAEIAEIFVNGNLVQEGDLFDSSGRILLTSSAQPGEEFVVALRLVSPNHDIGALMKSLLVYERNNNLSDPGFIADELTILYNYLTAFEPKKLA
ncbi:MAG: alpha-mannosidase, partial [Cyanobacteria bacterium P01_G01_bin.49]